MTTVAFPSDSISNVVPGGLSRTIAINRTLGSSTLPAAVVSTPSISVRMPISKSVADRTAVDPSTSNFTFVRTGLVDRVGTTTAAV